MSKCYIIYHNDNDGECSAAIATKYFTEHGKSKEDIVYIKGKHDGTMDIPDLSEHDYVTVLDYTLREVWIKYVIRITKIQNFLWIDHHVSHKDLYEKYTYISGIRNCDIAACELTYEYFYPGKEVPKFVKYIGDRDIWKWEYPDTAGFCEYMMFRDTKPKNEIWIDLFDENVKLSSLIETGNELKKARMYNLKRIIKDTAYEDKIDGERCVKINSSDITSTSDISQIMLDMVPYIHIAWVFYYKKVKGVEQINNSLRSNKNIDVSVMAKNRGGGGHKHAAGWIYKHTEANKQKSEIRRFFNRMLGR